MIMAALTFGIWAQEDAFAGLKSISLKQAQELAKKQNSAYAAKEAALSAAKWGKSNALSTFFPSLSFSGTLLYMDPATTVQTGAQTITMNNDSRTLALNLSQPLYLGGKLYQAYKMAGISEEMATYSLQAQAFTLSYEVENKYLSALQLHRVYQLSQTEIRSARENLSLAKLKLDSGLIASADYLRFQSNLATKEVSGLQAYTALQIVLQDFANYLGSDELSMPEELAVSGEQQTIDYLSEFDLSQTRSLSEKAMLIALRQNLSIKVLDKTEELSERAYRLSKGSWMPSLMLTGSRQYKDFGVDRYSFTASNQIMLNLSVPILPALGSYASVQKAKAEARKAALDNKSAVDGIKLGLESAVLTWVSSAKQIGSASLALNYSEELYAQMQERFRLNMLSAKDLLDAELMLSAARLAYSNAFYGYLKARSALMQSLALEDVTELITLTEN